MYKVGCPCGYRGEKYLHREFDRNALPRCPDSSCGGVLDFMMSYGTNLRYFEESRGRWIENMTDEPIYITSYKQYQDECKKHGVAPAPARRGMPGCWA